MTSRKRKTIAQEERAIIDHAYLIGGKEAKDEKIKDFLFIKRWALSRNQATAQAKKLTKQIKALELELTLLF